MFGRVRASPTPAEWLELERPHPKLLKDDSLSIFEATLVKLKQGSQRSLSSEHKLSPTSQDSMEFEPSADVSEDSTKVSGLCSKQGSFASSSSCDGSASVFSSPNQEQKRGREMSIHYLFSKYASSHSKQGSPVSVIGSSACVSACSSDSESTGCSKLLI